MEGAWYDVPVFGYGRKFVVVGASEVLFVKFFTICGKIFQNDAALLVINGAVFGDNLLELMGILFWEGCFS